MNSLAQGAFDLCMSKGTGVLNGYVYDADGKPVEGALVFGLLGFAEKVSRTSDDRGFFSFECVSPGNYFLRAKASGFMIDGKDIRVTKGEVTNIVFQLERGNCTVRGRIVDNDDHPLEAQVSLQRSGIVFDRTKSHNKSGKYEFSDLKEGVYEISADSHCHESRSWYGRIQGNVNVTLTLPIMEGCALIGKCDVCEQTKEVKYCAFCHAFICNDCRHNYPERVRAMMRRYLSKMKGEKGKPGSEESSFQRIEDYGPLPCP